MSDLDDGLFQVAPLKARLGGGVKGSRHQRSGLTPCALRCADPALQHRLQQFNLDGFTAIGRADAEGASGGLFKTAGGGRRHESA